MSGRKLLGYIIFISISSKNKTKSHTPVLFSKNMHEKLINIINKLIWFSFNFNWILVYMLRITLFSGQKELVLPDQISHIDLYM